MIWRQLDYKELKSFEKQWKDLELRLKTPDPFLTPEWIYPLSDGKMLFLAGFSDDESSMKVLLPIKMMRPGIHGVGGYVFSECFSAALIDSDSYENELFEEVSDFLKEIKTYLLRFSVVPDIDNFSSRLIEYLKESGWFVDVVDGKESPVTEYDGTFEEYYMNHLTKHKRRHLSRGLRHMDKIGSVRFEVVTGKNDWKSYISEMKEIENKSWKKESGLFSDTNYKTTIRQLEGMADRNALLIFFLFCGDKMVAWLIDIAIRNRLYAHNISFNEDFSSYGPGNLIFAESIRYCLDNNYEGIEWLGGRSRFKDTLATGFRQRSNVNLFRDSASGKVMQVLMKSRNAFKKQSSV